MADTHGIPFYPWTPTTLASRRGIIRDLAVERSYEGFLSGEPHGTLEGVFLLKRSGVPIAAWTRLPLPQEVISVMAATMVGSIDTIVGVIGGPRPESIVVETDRHRMLVRDLNWNAFLVLIAPKSTKAHTLRREARRIAARIVLPEEASGRGKGVPSKDAPSEEASMEFSRV